MMSLRKPVAASAAMMAALAVAGPATASAAPTADQPATAKTASLTCPIWYGISNPANGCEPYWAIELGWLERFWLP